MYYLYQEAFKVFGAKAKEIASNNEKNKIVSCKNYISFLANDIFNFISKQRLIQFTAFEFNKD